MLTENNVTWKMRVKELFVDYLFIIMYLTMLFGIAMVVYLVVLKGIPEFTELQSQLIASLTSVIPIVLIFSFLDYSNGSIGKRKAGLTLFYTSKNFGSSFVRNVIKFLPWQLAHLGVIHGIYTYFDALAIILTTCSMVLLLVMLVMGLVRKDKRHFGDFIAGTQTQINKLF